MDGELDQEIIEIVAKKTCDVTKKWDNPDPNIKFNKAHLFNSKESMDFENLCFSQRELVLTNRCDNKQLKIDKMVEILSNINKKEIKLCASFNTFYSNDDIDTLDALKISLS